MQVTTALLCARLSIASSPSGVAHGRFDPLIRADIAHNAGKPGPPCHPLYGEFTYLESPCSTTLASVGGVQIRHYNSTFGPRKGGIVEATFHCSLELEDDSSSSYDVVLNECVYYYVFYLTKEGNEEGRVLNLTAPFLTSPGDKALGLNFTLDVLLPTSEVRTPSAAPLPAPDLAYAASIRPFTPRTVAALHFQGENPQRSDFEAQCATLANGIPRGWRALPDAQPVFAYYSGRLTAPADLECWLEVEADA